MPRGGGSGRPQRERDAGRLERSSAETERALSATRRFAADVGHELRTPLTSIRANFDALRRNPDMPEASGGGCSTRWRPSRSGWSRCSTRCRRSRAATRRRRFPRERLDLGDTSTPPCTAARRRHPERNDRAERARWPARGGRVAGRAATARRQPDRERASPWWLPRRGNHLAIPPGNGLVAR